MSVVFMNPINGPLVNTTIVNAGTLKLGPLDANVSVEFFIPAALALYAWFWNEAQLSFEDFQNVLERRRFFAIHAPVRYVVPGELIMRGLIADVEAMFYAGPSLAKHLATNITVRTHLDDTEYEIAQRAWYSESTTSMSVPVVVGKVRTTDIELSARANPCPNVLYDRSTDVTNRTRFDVNKALVYTVEGAVKLSDCCDCPVYGPNLTFPNERCLTHGNYS